MMIRILLLLLIATPALAARDKEKLAICDGAASCSEVTNIILGDNDTVEFAIDDDTGCSDTSATYSIQGQNTAGTNWHEVVVLNTQTTGISSITLDPGLWFPTWRAVPSVTTGCSDLEINIWITRN